MVDIIISGSPESIENFLNSGKIIFSKEILIKNYFLIKIPEIKEGKVSDLKKTIECENGCNIISFMCDGRNKDISTFQNEMLCDVFLNKEREKFLLDSHLAIQI